MSDSNGIELTARDLVAGYVAGINILNGMSVDVLRGEVRCVLGPNGTGKSTLLKVLFGFLQPVSGEIVRNGKSLVDVPSHRMGQYGVTYLPQRPSIFPFQTVEANLRLGTWQFRKNRALAAERTEAAYARFPVLRERRRQLAGTMSGGQQRQLEFARALMTDPAVMLIDEPTASIEPRVAAQIYELIAGLARDGKAILLVDQNIKGALGIADHVYVMRTGTLLEEGPRAQFTADVEHLVARWLYTR
ncbi:MAG: ABC transporter ATP-binding protein [Proteobacteria bacterium]|nr:ABC transporter ATP-binding protein [Pseudomonadota bacterium]